MSNELSAALSEARTKRGFIVSIIVEELLVETDFELSMRSAEVSARVQRIAKVVALNDDALDAVTGELSAMSRLVVDGLAAATSGDA